MFSRAFPRTDLLVVVQLIVFLGGMAMGGLGMWGAGEAIKVTFHHSEATT